MAANQVREPFVNIPDADGTALNNGYVYIGTVSLNPTLNPITVYWDLALSIPAAQPIRTINGFYSQSGSPGTLYVDADDYSILIQNKNQVQIYSSLENSDVQATTPMSSVTGQLDSDRVDFDQAGAGAITRTAQDKFRDIVSVKDFGATGDGATDDTAAIQLALDAATGGLVYIPAGNYKISATLDISAAGATVRGDGVNITNLVCAAAFTGSDAVNMPAPTNCVLEDLTIDGGDNVANGLHINDGGAINIGRILIKNCTDIGYKIRNVSDCRLVSCGSENTGKAAFDFEASAALDTASSVTDGIKCVLLDCYSRNADSDAGGFGSIYSNQVDTSNIDVIVIRYNEITNGSTVSVNTNSVHLDHVIRLLDSEFLDSTVGTSIIFDETGVIRTDGITITGALASVVNVANIFGADDYAGLVHIIATGSEYSQSNAGFITSYLLLVTSVGSGVVEIAKDGLISGALASHPSFTWNLNADRLKATPIGSTSGVFRFYITQLGGLKITNV